MCAVTVMSMFLRRPCGHSTRIVTDAASNARGASMPRRAGTIRHDLTASPRAFCPPISRGWAKKSQAVVRAGADLVHFDVMDNHYVPESHGRPARVRGDHAALHGADRRAPHGEAGRSHRARFREGRREHHLVPSRGERARRPHDRAHPGAGLQGGARVQSGDAARLPRSRDGQARSRPHHVGESRASAGRRSSRRRSKSCARCASASTAAGATSGSRSTAA